LCHPGRQCTARSGEAKIDWDPEAGGRGRRGRVRQLLVLPHSFSTTQPLLPATGSGPACLRHCPEGAPPRTPRADWRTPPGIPHTPWPPAVPPVVVKSPGKKPGYAPPPPHPPHTPPHPHPHTPTPTPTPPPHPTPPPPPPPPHHHQAHGWVGTGAPRATNLAVSAPGWIPWLPKSPAKPGKAR
jgi:hypothetical protein